MSTLVSHSSATGDLFGKSIDAPENAKLFFKNLDDLIDFLKKITRQKSYFGVTRGGSVT